MCTHMQAQEAVGVTRLDFGSRVYLAAQWELARSLAERRLLAERECLGH